MTEPIWTQLVPLSPTRQYLLFWYIAETLPPKLERDINSRAKIEEGKEKQPSYVYPPRYPPGLTLPSRLAMEPKGYEPVRHEDTGVGSDEVYYQSFLIPVHEAKNLLRGSIQEDVVHRGWEAIKLRWAQESEDGSA